MKNTDVNFEIFHLAYFEMEQYVIKKSVPRKPISSVVPETHFLEPFSYVKLQIQRNSHWIDEARTKVLCSNLPWQCLIGVITLHHVATYLAFQTGQKNDFSNRIFLNCVCFQNLGLNNSFLFGLLGIVPAKPPCNKNIMPYKMFQ